MGAEGEQKLEAKSGERKPMGMNPAQFLSWKSHKDADASARKEAETRKRAEDIIAGTAPMTGRELFLHEPWVFDNTRY